MKIYLTQLGTQLHGKPPKLDADNFPSIEANYHVNSKLATNLALAISEVPVTSADAITSWFNGYTELDQHLLDEFLQDFPVALQVFEELEAAEKAGLQTIQIKREGNAQSWKQSVSDFSEIVLI